MEKKTFRICFFTRKTRPMKNGKYPVFMRLTVNGRRWDCSLKVGVETTCWDSKKEKATGFGKETDIVNETIESTRFRLHKIKLKIEDEGKPITLENVRDRYLDKESLTRTLVNLFEIHNSECEKKIGVQITSATWGRYKTCLKHLKEFLRKEFKTEDIPVSEICTSPLNSWTKKVETDL